MSNAADNADITQSQIRDTRHLEMQEASVRIADRFEANNVLCSFNIIQPYHLVLIGLFLS